MCGIYNCCENATTYLDQNVVGPIVLLFNDRSFSSICKKYYNSLSIMNREIYDKSKRKEAKLKLLLNRVKKYVHNYFGGAIYT